MSVTREELYEAVWATPTGKAAAKYAVGAFPDRGSAVRLVTAVALNVTAIWTDRRYLDMSLLKSEEVVVAEAA